MSQEFSPTVTSANLQELLQTYANLSAEEVNLPENNNLIKTAVRVSLQYLAKKVPGKTVEIRIPPWGAIQYLPGTTHRRGSPPNVVELPPVIWLDLVIGRKVLTEVINMENVYISGNKATELAAYLPLITLIA